MMKVDRSTGKLGIPKGEVGKEEAIRELYLSWTLSKEKNTCIDWLDKEIVLDGAASQGG